MNSSTTHVSREPSPLDYSSPRIEGNSWTQTAALFVDAYRELNARKMFWMVMALSVLVVIGFAIPGINERGITLFKLEFPGAWNTHFFSPGDFYKLMYVVFAIPIWLAWLATILAVVSTAGIFPDMLTGGSIDLYLCKPIGRLRLFFTKYLAGLLFVTLQVTAFSFASFLVIGIRGRSWEPGLFLAIPVIVVFFSYLFSICALLGVLTRSTVAAMLLTLLVWVFFWAGQTAQQTIHLFRITSEVRQERMASVIARNDTELERQRARPATTQTAGLIKNIEFQRDATLKQKTEALGTLRNLQLADTIAGRVTAVIPKTGQTIDLLRRALLKHAHLPGGGDDDENGNGRRRNRGESDFNPADPAVQKRLREDIDSNSPAYVIGTSLAFEAVVLALAAWIFCRRDY